jgi:hypothetical protein
MGRDELFSRIEVMKLAHAGSHLRGVDAVTEDFGKLWSTVVPAERSLDCGCGGKAAQQKGFQGTHVLPFSWTRIDGGVDHVMYAMDKPFLKLVHTGSRSDKTSNLVLSGVGLDSMGFPDNSAGLTEALQVGINHLAAWANAHPEEVRAYIESVGNHVKA